MGKNKSIYRGLFLEKTREFITSLTLSEQGKIQAQVEMMEMGKFNFVYTKSLKGPIKELVIGKYRFVFFIVKRVIYFVLAFVKKSQKTPKKYIEQAEDIYKIIEKK